MSVTGSCGHELIENDNDNDGQRWGVSIALKSTSKDGERAIRHGTVCMECAKQYRERGEELKTKEEQDNWMDRKRRIKLEEKHSNFKMYNTDEIQKVYTQHHRHYGTVLYSTDGGWTWQSVGVDSGKWDIHNWLFAFISIK